MSFTRFNYDTCRTKKKLQQSVDVGNYHLYVPGNGPNPKYIEDPNIRIQKWGGNLWTQSIDIDSNLKGINKRLSKNDTLGKINKIPNYNPTQIQYQSTSALNVSCVLDVLDDLVP